MIKVCHMTSVHKSQDVRILKKQCTGLAKADYEVYLVAPGESYEENGVQVMGVGENTGGRLKRMTQMTKRVYKKALELDCDIYELHDPELLPYALKLKHRGKTVIFDSHEDIIRQVENKEYLHIFFRKILSAILKIYSGFITKRLDKVIYVSPHYADIYPIEHKIMITNYPILVTTEFRKTEKIKNQLVFTGGVRKRWYQEKIIQTIQNLDVTYVVCGIGDASYIEQLKNIDKNNKFKYLGFISHNEALALQNESFAGVAIFDFFSDDVSKMGTLGNTKIFEYMMFGLPVICTDVLLWRQIIDKYDCGICVDPENTQEDELANAIQYLIENPKRAKQMGENGRKAVEQEYNWGREEEKLLALYKELSGEIERKKVV